jgi:rhodanese-related sulfurtransferase
MVIKDRESCSDDWMTALLKSPIFQRLPPINLQKILLKLEDIQFKKHEDIIKQGNEGDYYYLIKSGQCICTRKASPNSKKIKIRQLSTGDTFGEDALISGAPRDLTITALTDISLLRLDKERFISLIKEPSLSFVNYAEMQEAIKQGATLLDVRTPEEYKSRHIKGSINEPFFSLRMQLQTLNREKPYIVVCADGKVSEAAAFLLLNNKLEAMILKGGMAGVTSEPEEMGAISSADNIEAIDNRPKNAHQEHGIEQFADQSTGVFSNTIKSVFFQHFEQLLDDCCMRIDLEFGMQLGRKREQMSKDEYQRLREYLRSVRHDIKQNYLLKVEAIFDNSHQATANTPDEQPDLSKISLISEDAVKENNSLLMIIRKCEHLFHDELTKLNIKFAIQPGKQTIVDSQNPIFPDKLVRALGEVVKPLKLNTANKVVLHKVFEENVFSRLGVIYRELLNSGG